MKKPVAIPPLIPRDEIIYASTCPKCNSLIRVSFAPTDPFVALKCHQCKFNIHIALRETGGPIQLYKVMRAIVAGERLYKESLRRRGK